MVLQRAYETLVDDKKEVANIPASVPTPKS